MARSSRGIHRLIGAMQSRTIPPGTRCKWDGYKGCKCGPVECILVNLISGRHYLCRVHGEQGKALGYEVFDGVRRENDGSSSY